MRNIEFVKMVASGNDFVVIDTRYPIHDTRELSDLAKKICDRRYGIGADGLLVLGHPAKADIKMRIFNPDGSEAEMCGNGARCAALYNVRYQMPVAGCRIKIETKAGIVEAIVDADMVKLKMTEPRSIKPGPDINFINTGAPHAVVFVDDLENTDVAKLGRQIRNSEQFAPAGANVDFVKIIDEDAIAIRTYERGVEAETLACGTGAVAAAIISGRHNVMTAGKEVLKVGFDKNNNRISNVWLEGSARFVCKGEYCND